MFDGDNDDDTYNGDNLRCRASLTGGGGRGGRCQRHLADADAGETVLHQNYHSPTASANSFTLNLELKINTRCNSEIIFPHSFAQLYLFLFLYK